MATARNSDAYFIRGRPYVRVTRVLSVLARPGLVEWAAAQVAERAVGGLTTLQRLATQDPDRAAAWLAAAPTALRDEAAERGRAVHEAVRAVLLGAPTPWLGPAEAGCLSAFLKFWERERFQTILAAEGLVISETYGYAGTLDLLATDNASITLIDLKTTGDFRPEHDLQVTAYAFADIYHDLTGQPRPMPAVDRLLIVRLNPNGTYATREIFPDPETLEVFLACLRIYRWLTRTHAEVPDA